MSPAEARELARLAGLAADVARARLAGLRQEEEALRARLGALDQAQAGRAARALAGDAALHAGADQLWEIWVADRRAALTAELARLLARRELALEAARRAFGRELAASGLAQATARTAAARRARAAERGG
jgi:hypothetical protein